MRSSSAHQSWIVERASGYLQLGNPDSGPRLKFFKVEEESGSPGPPRLSGRLSRAQSPGPSLQGPRPHHQPSPGEEAQNVHVAPEVGGGGDGLHEPVLHK